MRAVLIGVVAGCVGANAAAETNCRARVLEPVAALEQPTTLMPRGKTFDYITQYRVTPPAPPTPIDNGAFCQHGGYCYPQFVMIAGERKRALRLVNCQVVPLGHTMYGSTVFDLVPLRRHARPAARRPQQP